MIVARRTRSFVAPPAWLGSPHMARMQPPRLHVSLCTSPSAFVGSGAYEQLWRRVRKPYRALSGPWAAAHAPRPLANQTCAETQVRSVLPCGIQVLMDMLPVSGVAWSGKGAWKVAFDAMFDLIYR